jgi:hypothetical protein
MADNSLGRSVGTLIIGVLAVVGGIYVYNHYVEPQNDGPMESASEKIDKAIDGK